MRIKNPYRNIKRFLLRLFISLSVILFFYPTFAQEELSQGKDNSKPTNVYSQADNFLEFTSYEKYNTFGYNPRLTYTPNEDNALILEVPFLYSTLTDKFGLSDIRLRYFYIPYRDYTKTFGSFGLSMDMFMPTGKVENGLGSSSWRFSPGLTFGLIANKAQTISLFPVISYIFTTEPTSDQIPDEFKESDHGINLQVISSFILSEDAFLLVTPIYDIKDLEDEREDDFLVEIESVFDIMKDKYQIGGFYRAGFLSNVHTFRVFFPVFL
jgi:hypothetical protein